MSFWIILVNYILPPLLALIGAFFGVLFGCAITIRYFQAKPKKPVGATYNNKNKVGQR